MTRGRLVAIVTCLVVAGLGTVLTVMRWEDANRTATIVSAMAAVAGVGLAVWAGLSGRAGGTTVKRTGNATARGKNSRANSGLSGHAGTGRPVELRNTGEATAEGGGEANSGLESS